MMPCILCKEIKVKQDPKYVLLPATRVVSWETIGSPMVPVCDNHAFALAREQFLDYHDMKISPLDDAISVGETHAGPDDD